MSGSRSSRDKALHGKLVVVVRHVDLSPLKNCADSFLNPKRLVKFRRTSANSLDNSMAVLLISS